MKKQDVENVLKNQKNVFWEALVIALFIFGLGILLGVFIENSRADRISEMYLKSEINLLDVRIFSETLDLENIDCEQAIEKNIQFGDKIFEDAKTIQRYEDASRISDSLIEQHKKYDLLRFIFWLNSIKLKEKCNADFHTIVYLYDFNTEDEEEKSKKEVFSRFLGELKQEKGNEILLIPIAKDLGISSLEVFIAKYEIEDIAIIIDEELIVSDLDNLEKVEQALD